MTSSRRGPGSQVAAAKSWRNGPLRSSEAIPAFARNDDKKRGGIPRSRADRHRETAPSIQPLRDAAAAADIADPQLRFGRPAVWQAQLQLHAVGAEHFLMIGKSPGRDRVCKH